MSQILPRDYGKPTPKPKKRVKPNKWRQAPIKQVGKITKQWRVFREEYFTRHPGNWLNQHMCAHCGNWFPKAQIDLDHIQGRGSHPELRFEDANIQKLCRTCHQRKTIA